MSFFTVFRLVAYTYHDHLAFFAFFLSFFFFLSLFCSSFTLVMQSYSYCFCACLLAYCWVKWSKDFDHVMRSFWELFFSSCWIQLVTDSNFSTLYILVFRLCWSKSRRFVKFICSRFWIHWIWLIPSYIVSRLLALFGFVFAFWPSNDSAKSSSRFEREKYLAAHRKVARTATLHFQHCRGRNHFARWCGVLWSGGAQSIRPVESTSTFCRVRRPP